MRSVVGFAVMAGMLVLVLGSCQHSEDRYLKRDVTAAEVAGTWQMTPASVKDLRNEIIGYPAPIEPSEHRIIIHADGTCVFETFPTDVVRDGKVATRIQADCRWKLGRIGHQTLEIEIPSPDPTIPGAAPRDLYYYFDETRDGRVLLWQHLDDPDQWKYIEYVKL